MQWRFCLTTVLGVVLSVMPSVKVQAQGLESLTYYTENYPPLNIAKEDGKPAGIAVDLLQEAAAAVNVVLDSEQILVQPWPRSYRSALLNQDGVFFLRRAQHIVKIYLIGSALLPISKW
ncbi:hypothetical protein VCSRO6_1803 [Vibrio cholerae]|nr:hypothetical protein VCSRO6_1803 [Vibrio cholerae]GIA62564.1 hypothetical protein VCSRO4_1539 [Vibrio cholerae]